MFYKFRVYVPPESLESMMAVVRPLIASSEKYMGAMSFYPVESVWTTLPGADPYNGKHGEETHAKEYVIEFRVKKEDKQRALNEILRGHPYEEPGIDIMELI